MQNELKTTKEENDGLNEASEEENKLLTTKLKAEKTAKETIEKAQAETETKLTSIQNELTSVQNELKTTKEENDELLKIYEAMKKAKEDVEKAKETTEKAQAKTETKLKTVQNELTTAKNAADAIQEKLNEEINTMETAKNDMEKAKKAAENAKVETEIKSKKLKEMLEKTITKQEGTIKHLKKIWVNCKLLSKAKRTTKLKNAKIMNDLQTELETTKAELEAANDKLIKKSQASDKFKKTMRSYAKDDEPEETDVEKLYEETAAQFRWGVTTHCNNLTIKEKIKFNSLVRDLKYTGNRLPLEDDVTVADIEYVEKLKEQREQCVKFLDLNGANGCLQRIKELERQVLECEYNSDFDNDEESSSDEETKDGWSQRATKDDRSQRAEQQQKMRVDRHRSRQHVQNNDSSEDVKYKAFKYKGLWRCVRYEAPEGLTQNNNSYYYGIIVDGDPYNGQAIIVRGKDKVQEYKEFRPIGYDWIRVRYVAPNNRIQGVGGYYFGVTDDKNYLKTNKKEVNVNGSDIPSRIRDYSILNIYKKRAVNQKKPDPILRMFIAKTNHKLEKKLMF